jgi:predicted O-linked N-acetylglucosamine transferase (SPINDLY family)
LGYVSSDLRAHAVACFFEPLVTAHDSTKFEIFCYDTNVRQTDVITERLRGAVEHWRSVGGKSDEELAKIIHEDEIDVLVDLSGHTAGNRLKAFTYRPALVQATYLGFFAATGLESMDYWITDEVLHPQDTPEKTVERIYRLHRCWVSYKPPAEAPMVAPCPSTDDKVILGSFSNLSKLTDEVIDTWSKLLRELPGSHLLVMAKPLGNPKTRQLFVERFEQRGILADRLLIHKGAPTKEYLATYAKVDIVLDPFPRTGGTTTAEALWMGVPVVTLAGPCYAGRLSASKLVAVGLDDLITSSREDYIKKVVSLAHDPDRRAELRVNLRDTMARSPLCDGEGLARTMETAYETMWHRAFSDDN